MHYQFYCWYFHMIPYLLWSTDVLATPVRLAIWVAIEVAFNVYPATFWSSLLLQVAHFVLLIALYAAPAPLCNENLRVGETISPSLSSSSSLEVATTTTTTTATAANVIEKQQKEIAFGRNNIITIGGRVRDRRSRASAP